MERVNGQQQTEEEFLDSYRKFDQLASVALQKATANPYARDDNPEQRQLDILVWIGMELRAMRCALSFVVEQEYGDE